MPASLEQRVLRDALARLTRGLVGRDEQARCLLLAALCGEHVLLIGPPGTAKSELARRLRRQVGGRYFERLLTRFTVPEELFGPLSLAALDEGRYLREIDGYLPTASVAFLDEVFKANSAILNALLTLLNERAFDQGAQRIAVPLATLVAASNEVPDDASLRAFVDRFLFRCTVAPVSDEAFESLLRSDVSSTDDGGSGPGGAGVGPGRRGWIAGKKRHGGGRFGVRAWRRRSEARHGAATRPSGGRASRTRHLRTRGTG
jgi:MoxR-like ATPase